MIPHSFNETYNKEIIAFLVDRLKLNVSSDVIPRNVVPTIQPTFEVYRPFCNIVRRASSATTGNTTIFTTPAGQDFYLCSVWLSYVKDATNDGVNVTITAPIEGTAQRLMDHNTATTTAVNGHWAEISFPVPIKIDRNATILLAKTFTAGTGTYSAGLTGFTVDAGNQLSV